MADQKNQIVSCVQIGANIGDDDITKIIYTNPVHYMVAVEPMSLHNTALAECYLNVVPSFYISNIIITSENTDQLITLYYNTNDGPQYQIASTNIDHIKKHYPGRIHLQQGEIRSIQVNTKTITQLLDEHHLMQLDLLAIDAEGSDFDILASIDYDQYDISHIIYESVHINRAAANKFLTDKGYQVIDGVGLGNMSSYARKVEWNILT